MKKFSQALRDERTNNRGGKTGRSVRDLARGVSVPEATVSAWEAGTLSPSRAEFGRLCVHLPPLRHFRPESFAPRKASAGDLVGDPTHLDVASFGEALRTERELEAMSQAELGEVLGVTGQAVAAWEVGQASPVRENYESILVLFPELRSAPEPDWKNIDTPDGGRGVPRISVRAVPVEPVLAALPVLDVGALSVERLINAFNEVRVTEAPWTLTVMATGMQWTVEITSRTGTNVSTSQSSTGVAFAVLFGKLTDEIDRRIAELEALRAQCWGSR